MARRPRHRGQGVRRRGRVAVVGRVRRRGDPGGRRPPPGVRLRRVAGRRCRRRDTRRGAGQRRVGAPEDGPRAGSSPTAWPPADLDLWRDELVAFPAVEKVALALELERRVRAGDPRIRQVESAYWGDSADRDGGRDQHRHPGRRRRGPTATSPPTPSPAKGADTQTGGGYSVGRGPVGHRPRQGGSRRRRPGHPAARRPQAEVAPPSPSSSSRGSPRPCSRILAGTLNGESVLKGRSLFADRVGEEVSVPAADAGRRPDRPRRLRGRPLRRRGAGLPAERADRRRRAAGVPVQHLCRPPGRDGVDRLGGAGRLQERTRRRRPGASARARHAVARADPGPGRRRPAGPVGLGDPLRCQPHQRRLLGRCRRHDHPGGGPGRAGPGDHHRLDPPAHAPRRRRHRQRRRAAAVLGDGSDAGRRPTSA